MEKNLQDSAVRAITVFCGARDGASPEYMKLAYDVGKTLAQNHSRLVYGGGNVGLMGAVAKGCLDHSGYVIGVIPQALMNRELALKEAQELIVVKSMHERKAMMAHRADAFLTLPGGFGTLDEIFEIITWKQLGIHQKPVYFLNQNGYYDALFAFCKHMMKEGFISQADFENIHILANLEEFKKLWKKSKES